MVRAPAEFVVLRHLLTHPEDAPADLHRHCHLHLKTASLVLKRLRDQDVWTEDQIVARLRTLSERPRWRTLGFEAPNPPQWLRAHKGTHWTSGDYAAAKEGVPIVPERLIAWVPAIELLHAQRAADDVLAKPVRAHAANLVLRIADRWLGADPTHPDLVERGQRIWDYDEFPNLQVLRRRR
jgi:hypothetical protein